MIGGTSFVGRHLLPRLTAGGADVAATFRTDPPPANDGVQWLRADVAEGAADWPACDTVIYLAQSRNWRRFPDDAADIFDVNVRGVFVAAEHARRTGASRLIFASTGSVYDVADVPLRETDLIDVGRPRHFYVAAKLSAELILNAFTPTLKVVVLRLFVPYGHGQSPDMLLPQLVRKVQAGEPIHLDGEDGLRVNPVAIRDVAHVIERCVTLDASGTYNVAGPEVLSLRDVAEGIGRALGRTPVFSKRAPAAASLVGDTTALAARLGWAPSTRFADGLREWLLAPAPFDVA